ncbi:MAG: PepSY domain-containing protein [Actinobacteria bacterium]|nr:PepSY domain-containing protein [Actinomycetota bacterium]MDQ3533562.1 hypothetical protein [Actinomycetota bacterium]
MSKRRLIVAVAATLALLGAGTGVVLASAGDGDKPLEGKTLDQATSAALDHVGGGTVVETEIGDDGAAYGVEIRKDDGSVVEVNLDGNYSVIGAEPDEDGPDDSDGPGGD